MKKVIIAAVALSLLGASAASAAPYRGADNPRGNGYQQGHRYDQRAPARRVHWRQGQRLPPGYWNRGQYVDYRVHRLRPPPRGYRWVRTNDGDYLMVAIATGLIASVILNNNGY